MRASFVVIVGFSSQFLKLLQSHNGEVDILLCVSPFQPQLILCEWGNFWKAPKAGGLATGEATPVSKGLKVSVLLPDG